MTGTEMQGQIQRIVNDVSATAWTPTQYLEAINAAIVRVAEIMEKKSDADLLYTMAINSGDLIPEYFIRFAGTYPVQQENGRFICGATLTAKYYRMPSQIVALADTIDFRSRKSLEAIKLASAIYLKEQRGTFDMKNEKERLAELLA